MGRHFSPRPLGTRGPKPKKAMTVPVCASDSLGDLRKAAIGPAVPREALFKDCHPLQLAVPFPNEQRPGLEARSVAHRWTALLERAAMVVIGIVPLRLSNDPQRPLVQFAKRRGLDPIGQNPPEQPARQMGGSDPAQMIAPLEAKLVDAKVGEARNDAIDRIGVVRQRRQARRSLLNAVRISSIGHHAARNVCDLLWRSGDFDVETEVGSGLSLRTLESPVAADGSTPMR